MAGTWGAGSVGCAVAAGAVGGAVTNLWKSQVQHTQQFSVASFATDTVFGAAAGVVTLGAGAAVSSAVKSFVAPAVKAAAGAISSAVRTAAPRAAAASQSAGQAAGKAVTAVRSVAKRSTQARECPFAAATGVLMADGSTKAIADVQVGDQVLASDPQTGEQAAKTVEHVWVHDDTLTDLVIDSQVITATEDHPFWSDTDHRFERADQLAAGEKVLAADGTTVAVTGFDAATTRTAPAYNLTIADIHTYHVGTPAILVHNTCPTGITPAETADAGTAPGLLDRTIREGALSKHVKGTNEHATASVADTLGKSTFAGPGSARRIVEMALDRGTPFFDKSGVLKVRWDAGVTTGFGPDGGRLTGVVISYSKKGWHGWPTNL